MAGEWFWDEDEADGPVVDPRWRYVPPADESEVEESWAAEVRDRMAGRSGSGGAAPVEADTADAGALAGNVESQSETAVSSAGAPPHERWLRMGLEARGKSPAEIEEFLGWLDSAKFTDTDGGVDFDRVLGTLDAVDAIDAPPKRRADLGQGCRGTHSPPPIESDPNPVPRRLRAGYRPPPGSWRPGTPGARPADKNGNP